MGALFCADNTDRDERLRNIERRLEDVEATLTALMRERNYKNEAVPALKVKVVTPPPSPADSMDEWEKES